MPQKVRRNALYRRISTDDQEKGSSLSDQLDAFKAAVIRDGGVFKEDHIFTDTMSGSGKYWRDREGIQNMLVSAKRHEFDYLYVYCLDRFGRDVVIQEFLIQELKHYGVTVISLKADEPTDRNDMISQMARWFWGMMAQEELKKIKERTQRGIKSRVIKKQAILTSSRPLYGYHWQDKVMEWEGERITVPKAVYVVYEPEAKVVRYIYQLALERTPLRKIAKILTDMSVPTPNGLTLWRPTSVHNILANPFYTGQAHAFKTKSEYQAGQGLHRERRSKEEWIPLAQGCVPQLIDIDTFERVQQILRYNQEHAYRNNPDAEDTLCRSGLAICGYCGGRLAVNRVRQKREKHIRVDYYCYRHKQGYAECEGVKVTARVLDEIAWQKAVEIIKQPSIIEEELRKQRIEDPTTAGLKTAEALLQETVQAIINVTQSIEATTNPAAIGILTKRLEELALLKEGYEEQYDAMLRYRINWEDAMRALDNFKAWCDEIRPKLTNPDYQPSYREKREALEIIGIKVAAFQATHDPRFRLDIDPPDIIGKFRIVSRSPPTFYCPRQGHQCRTYPTFPL